MQNFDKLNEYKFIFENKETGAVSYHITWCYGNIFDDIERYKKDLSKMCLIGVSNKTHTIIKVIHLFDNAIIYPYSAEV